MFTDATQELLDVTKVGDGSRDTYYTWVGEYQGWSNQNGKAKEIIVLPVLCFYPTPWYLVKADL